METTTTDWLSDAIETATTTAIVAISSAVPGGASNSTGPSPVHDADPVSEGNYVLVSTVEGRSERCTCKPSSSLISTPLLAGVGLIGRQLSIVQYNRQLGSPRLNAADNLTAEHIHRPPHRSGRKRLECARTKPDKAGSPTATRNT